MPTVFTSGQRLAQRSPCAVRPEPRAVPPRYRPVLAERPVTQSAPIEETTSAFAATEIGLATRSAHVTLLTGVAPNEEEWAARGAASPCFNSSSSLEDSPSIYPT